MLTTNLYIMRFIVLFVSLFVFTAVAPNPPENLKKVRIKTSANCGMCKAAIEKALYALEGVAHAELDLVTRKVKVSYDSEQQDVNTLRQAIAAAGYDADEVPARPKAYEALPGCCKKEGSCTMPEGKG